EEGRLEFARDFERDRVILLQRTIWDDRVSTIWLGLDHTLGDGSPLIFETMVFDGHWDSELQWRYSTEEQARAGHRRAFWRTTLVPPPLRRFASSFFDQEEQCP